MLFLIFIFVSFINIARPSSWNITVQLNPGCDKDCNEFNIVHAIGRCSNSSVHFLFGASKYIGPSVIALQSDNPDATLTIDWNEIANGTGLPAEAIKLDGVQQSYAIVFTNLVEYDDIHDRADMTASGYEYRLYQFNTFRWMLNAQPWTDAHELKDDEIFRVAFIGDSLDSVFNSNGSIKIEFMLSNADRHNTQMPRLRFVPCLTIQFELHLAGLLSNYTRGRFATQLALISQDPIDPNEDFVQTSSVSINDEITPGIFEMIDIHLNERTHSPPPSNISVSAMNPSGAFVQTRPVCYVSDSERQVATSRDARLSPHRDRPMNRYSLTRSLPYWFFGDRLIRTVGIRVQNVSFGTPVDGYYANSKYIIWSASFGLGRPPVDSLSALLIGLISLSVVVILASGLFGTVVLVLLRLRSRSRTEASEPLLQPYPTA